MSKKKPVIALVSWADDWDALYIDGTLVRSDHSVRANDLLDLLEDLGVVELKETPTWEDPEATWAENEFLYPAPPANYDEIFTTDWAALEAEAKRSFEERYGKDEDAS